MKRFVVLGMPLLFSIMILAGILFGFSIPTAASERISGLPQRANPLPHLESDRTNPGREFYSSPDQEACSILLVDDDEDYGDPNGGGRPYYTSTLDALNYTYTVWDTDIYNSPTATIMAPYDVVIWFTGYDYVEPVTGAEEDEIIAYLQGSGNLFMSNQEQYYYANNSLSPLMTDYLWVDSVNGDVILTGTEGNESDPLFAGLGPYIMGRPDQWSVYWPTGFFEGPFDDAVFVRLGGFEPLIYSDLGIPNSARFAGDGFKTIYLGFPFEWLPNINDRMEILGAALEWMCSDYISDLEVTQQDYPDPVFASEAMTYTIVVENHGPDGATGVTVIDILPVSFAYDLSNGIVCTEDGGVVTCIIGNLATGESVTFTIVTTATEVAGVYTNQSMVTGNEIDPDSSNNTAVEETTVNEILTDIKVSKSDYPDPVKLGEMITYTILVENLGPNNATGVTVIDTLPADVTYVSSSWVGCVEASGVITCDIGDLATGGSVTFTIIGMAPETAGVYTNQVEVMGNEVDADLTNNTATEDTTVAGVPKIYLPIVSRE